MKVNSSVVLLNQMVLQKILSRENEASTYNIKNIDVEKM